MLVVPHEGCSEAAVAPQLLEPACLGLAFVEHGNPTGVVRRRGNHHDHGDEQSECVDETERFTAGDLLPGVISPWSVR